MVTTARVLALRRGVQRHATGERFAGLIAAGHGGADIAGFDADHALALDLILSQQLADIAEGVAPSNRVAVKPLTRDSQEKLKEAFGRQAALAEVLRAALSD